MRHICIALLAALSAFAQTAPVKAPTDVAPGSITYEEIAYPYPVHYLPLTLYGQDVRMAYMDVPPSGTPNGKNIIMFHGMNFGGFYFAGPIEVLRKEGYRIIVTDQIGFGRSSKPVIPYNFHDMAANSKKVLDSLGITRVTVIGHSMGGMLTARFSSSYPDLVERAVIYNPIGLKDPRGAGPWRQAQDTYKATMASTPDQLYAGFSATIHRYFAQPGAWKPEYEQYIRILYAPTLSADWPRLAMVRAITSQMPYLDPVDYDWARIKAPVAVLGGAKDTPDYVERSNFIAKTIPKGETVFLPNLGHVPHIENPAMFNEALLKYLRKP